MPKLKIPKELYQRIKDHAQEAGYSSVDEFIVHLVEKELENLESAESEEEIKNKLKGLGYLG